MPRKRAGRISGAVTKAVKASSHRERRRERANAALVPVMTVNKATTSATFTLLRRALMTSGSPNASSYQRKLKPANGSAVVGAALNEKRSINATGANRKRSIATTRIHQIAVEPPFRTVTALSSHWLAAAPRG